MRFRGSESAGFEAVSEPKHGGTLRFRESERNDSAQKAVRTTVIREFRKEAQKSDRTAVIHEIWKM